MAGRFFWFSSSFMNIHEWNEFGLTKSSLFDYWSTLFSDLPCSTLHTICWRYICYSLNFNIIRTDLVPFVVLHTFPHNENPTPLLLDFEIVIVGRSIRKFFCTATKRPGNRNPSPPSIFIFFLVLPYFHSSSTLTQQHMIWDAALFGPGLWQGPPTCLVRRWWRVYPLCALAATGCC